MEESAVLLCNFLVLKNIIFKNTLFIRDLIVPLKEFVLFLNSHFSSGAHWKYHLLAFFILRVCRGPKTTKLENCCRNATHLSHNCGGSLRGDGRKNYDSFYSPGNNQVILKQHDGWEPGSPLCGYYIKSQVFFPLNLNHEPQLA